LNDPRNKNIKTRPTNASDNNLKEPRNDIIKIRATNNLNGTERNNFVEKGKTALRNNSDSDRFSQKMTIRDSEEEIKELERVEKLLSDWKKNEQERNDIKRRLEARLKRNSNIRNDNRNIEANNQNNYGNYLNGLLSEFVLLYIFSINLDIFIIKSDALKIDL
jgi:hypothetical protein